MAMTNKHRNQEHRTDIPLFTVNQRQRFTEVANQAQDRREQEQLRPTIISAARRAARTPVVPTESGKPNRVRQVCWLLTFLAFCLWLMYMNG